MKTPLVVIVGRPNVGKSTLFNRLTGIRDAIVHDVSGVTRDRNYGEVDWNGRLFRLIDTGGYVPDSADLFDTAIREQISLALTESTKIIFVVDVRHGITPVDTEIAKILRTSGKECYLVVNKADNEKFAMMATEFYELALGDPYSISALNGGGVGDFLDELTKDFPLEEELEEEEEDTRIKLALVGRPNVGKSSLTNALLGFDRSIVTDIPGTTRDSVDSVFKYYGEEIVLIDTAGLRKRTKVKESVEYFSTIRTLKAVADSTVSVVMLDAQHGLERQDQRIIDEAIQRRKGIIIAVNKWDLIEKDSKTAQTFEQEIHHKLGSIDYIPIIFISAKTKQRMYKLIDLAKEVHEERKRKIPTNELNEVLLEEIEMKPPPTTPTGKEVKIKYVTQVGDKYPIFLFFSNYPKFISDSYRRFLENTIRKHYTFKGVPFTITFKEK